MRILLISAVILASSISWSAEEPIRFFIHKKVIVLKKLKGSDLESFLAAQPKSVDPGFSAPRDIASLGFNGRTYEFNQFGLWCWRIRTLWHVKAEKFIDEVKDLPDEDVALKVEEFLIQEISKKAH